MGHDQPTATEVGEGGRKKISRLAIKVVRRFIEEQDVGVACECGPDLPAFSLTG